MYVAEYDAVCDLAQQTWRCVQSYEYVAYGLVYAARNAELYLTQPRGCSDMCNAVCDLAQENIAMSM